MDIKRLIPVIALLGVFVWGGMKLKKGFTNLMNTDVTQKEESMGSLPSNLSRSALGQYIRAAKKMDGEIGLSAVSKECVPYVSAVESLDLTFYKDANFKVTYQQLMEPSSTCSLTDDMVASSEKEYLTNCFLSNPTKSDLINDACVQSIYALRSSMTHMLLKSKKISDVDTLAKLTDLLYYEVLLSKAPDAQLDLKRVEEIVDQMLELNSSFKAAKRIQIYVLSLNTLQKGATKTLKEQENLWANVASELENAKKANLLEDQSEALDALVETHGFDPSLTLKYATTLLANNPSSGWGEFLSAYAHWKTDDHEDAFKEVKKAVELAPQDEGFKKSLDLITTPGAGEESFRPGLKLGLSLQDFDK